MGSNRVQYERPFFQWDANVTGLACTSAQDRVCGDEMGMKPAQRVVIGRSFHREPTLSRWMPVIVNPVLFFCF